MNDDAKRTPENAFDSKGSLLIPSAGLSPSDVQSHLMESFSSAKALEAVGEKSTGSWKQKMAVCHCDGYRNFEKLGTVLVIAI